MKVFFALAAGFLVSVLSMPLVIYISNKKGLYDTIDERKVHTGNVSRLGGIGFTAGFVVSLLLLKVFGLLENMGQNLYAIILAGVCISVMGIWDDMKPLRPRIKLLLQCLAAILVLVGGFRFSVIDISNHYVFFNLGFLSYPITFIWIVGVTNAYNLIDGIDGQAGMLSALAAVSFSFIFRDYGNMSASYISLALVCAVAGFLLFNLPIPKAKLFMGDGGSQFLGFVLSVLPLITNKRGTGGIVLPYAAAILIIPIFDTFAAIWRRVREKRRIDSPDKFHLHHKLMLMGFDNRGALIIVCCMQIIINLLMTVVIWVPGGLSALVLGTVYAVAVLFFTIIHVKKQSYLQREKNQQ